MIRKVLRLLGSRYGIATVLLLAVVGVVLVARANTEEAPGPGTSEGDTGVSDEGKPNDGVADPSETGPPESDLPKAAVETATEFATAWVDVDRSQEDWYSDVSKLGTERIQEQLKQTDPARVPATELRDKPVASGRTVELNTDGGLLILRMTKQDGNWLVDGIDFENP